MRIIRRRQRLRAPHIAPFSEGGVEVPSNSVDPFEHRDRPLGGVHLELEANPIGVAVAEFLRLIQPQLSEVAPSVLAEATGLSSGYCAQIRAGKRVPHTRHWATLHLAGLRT